MFSFPEEQSVSARQPTQVLEEVSQTSPSEQSVDERQVTQDPEEVSQTVASVH